MIVLALDSSADTATVSLTDGNTPIAQSSFRGAKTHSETLLPMITRLLELSHLTLSEIDLFACGVGPGSFTGIRIGVSVLKGLAFGRNKPCVALSSLDILAYPYYSALTDITVVPVMDARRNTFYNALYRNGEKLTPDRLTSAEDLQKELQARGEKVLLCGDGAPALERQWGVQEFLCPASALTAIPCPYGAALCALDCFEKGKNVTTDTALIPVYLRPTQAERELAGDFT